MRVLIFHGTSTISKAIQWQTRSIYSHAAVLFDDGTLIESVEGTGVRKIEHWAVGDSHLDIFQLDYGPGQASVVRDFMELQVGKGYDWTMIVRFITRRQETRAASKKWFCSELVFAAMLQADIHLLERIEPWAVSPGLLSLSPLLKLERRV